MVQTLITDHEHIIRTLRCIRPAIDDIGDDATGRLLDDRLTAHEKVVWMLKSLTREVGAGPHLGEAVSDSFEKLLMTWRKQADLKAGGFEG